MFGIGACVFISIKSDRLDIFGLGRRVCASCYSSVSRNALPFQGGAMVSKRAASKDHIAQVGKGMRDLPMNLQVDPKPYTLIESL